MLIFLVYFVVYWSVLDLFLFQMFPVLFAVRFFFTNVLSLLMYKYRMDLCDELCSSDWPAVLRGLNFYVGHNTQTVQPISFIPDMLTNVKKNLLALFLPR